MTYHKKHPASCAKLIASLEKCDPLAAELMKLSTKENDHKRANFLSAVAMIFAGGTLPVFEEMAAPALLVAVMTAKEPPGYTEDPADAGSALECPDHFPA